MQRLRRRAARTAPLIAIALLLISASAAEAQSGLYRAERGPSHVEVAKDHVLNDAERNRDLHLRVTYPVGSGPFPAIVFSHGAWGTNYNYVPLAEHWASWGYVVVQPNHRDSMAEGVEFRDTRVFALDYWLSRVADCRFLLDRINDLGIADLAGKIDTDALAVGGHSYGANTTMALGGAVFTRRGVRQSYGDTRVKAIAVISGQGLGPTLDESSWKAIKIPMLVVTGSRDPGRGGQGWQWRVDPYTYASPGGKVLLLIDEADHSFGGATDQDPDFPRVPMRDLPKRPDHVDYLQSATTALWDAHLRGSTEAESALAAGAMDKITHGAVEVRAK